jgi:hypothetical protein
MATNTRKLASLLGASGAGIGNDGLMQSAGIDTDMATQAELDAVTAASEAADNKITSNQAILAIRQAADHNDVKYSLQDRIIDNYYDASGIDGTPSTNHVLTAGAYGGSSSGGTISQDADATGTHGTYTWYKWTDHSATGSIVISGATIAFDYLVVAGGGGTARSQGSTGGNGGAGAGGMLTAASLSVSPATYTVTVGDGGVGRLSSNGVGTSGGNSSIAGSGITDIVSTGGGFAGGAASSTDADAGNGGSGGGSAGTSGNTGGTGVVGQGTAGGSAAGYGGCGGGGKAVAGANSVSGNVATAGGLGEDQVMGLSASDSYAFLGAASAGHDSGGARYFAGGGSGNNNGGGTMGLAGGLGGGGASATSQTTLGTVGTDGTGGGAGASGYASQNGMDGGSGIVILRTLTSNTIGVYNNLTLQSTDTTAETEPDYADMVMLIEDSGGTPAVINTDIKGSISEDSGVTFTEGVLVDEGDWGTNKRILAFHDLDISAQNNSGNSKSMCYKITTHNQSASKETKIHATSIGWR